MRGVYLVETGVFTAEAGIEVIVVVFCTISQVMDRFHTKSVRLRKKAFIKELLLLLLCPSQLQSFTKFC